MDLISFIYFFLWLCVCILRVFFVFGKKENKKTSINICRRKEIIFNFLGCFEGNINVINTLDLFFAYRNAVCISSKLIKKKMFSNLFSFFVNKIQNSENLLFPCMYSMCFSSFFMATIHFPTPNIKYVLII